MRISY